MAEADRLNESANAALYRMLPAVHELLTAKQTGEESSLHRRRVQAVRAVLSRIRVEIAQNLHSTETLARSIDDLPNRIDDEMSRDIAGSLRPVINATGVILHTNLGRAPLSRKAIENVQAVAAGYSNLEFDLEHGERGRRDAHVESHLLTLLGGENAEDIKSTHGALVVNNCAAATFLALRSLARGRQVLVSRGELVEIGGGFRIPEILEESGAALREVGTTNRTRIGDFERAITQETALILRVHQSNFAMDGFVERPDVRELVALGRRSAIPVFEDQGTGLVEPLERFGVRDEPTLPASVRAGCDVVAASGDKLLGGPQCGILIGRRDLVEAMRKSPLYRTFRVDKLAYAALEATLIEYLYGNRAEVPVLRMLAAPEKEIRDRCENIVSELSAEVLGAEVIRVEGVIGGGAAPGSRVPSYAIALRHARIDGAALLAALRQLERPVIARIESDRVLLDLRTVEPEFDGWLAESLNRIAGSSTDPKSTGSE